MQPNYQKIAKYALIVLIALAALVVIKTAVFAADKGGPNAVAQLAPDTPVAAKSWTGIYLGVGVGKGFSNTEVSMGGLSIDGLGADGIQYDIAAGFDVQIPGSAVVLGARASYMHSDVEFAVKPGLFSVGLDNGWAVDGRIGWSLGTALPYVLLGYGETETQGSVMGTAIPGMPTLKGKRYGGGVEFRLANPSKQMVLVPTLALEYVHTDNDTLTYGPVSINPDVDSVWLRLNLNVQPFVSKLSP